MPELENLFGKLGPQGGFAPNQNPWLMQQYSMPPPTAMYGWTSASMAGPGQLAPGLFGSSPVGQIASLGFNALASGPLNNMANEQGYMLGQIGGGRYNAYDAMMAASRAQMQDQAMAGARSFDQQRMSQFLGRLGNDPSEVARYMEIYNAVPGGMQDFLAEALMGGSSASLGNGLFTANNMMSPLRRVNIDQMGDATMAIMNRFAPGGGAEDRSYTRGFTTTQFGQMAQELAARGQLSIEPERMADQLGNAAESLDAIRQLIGAPDAPIPKLMQALEQLAGAGAGQMSMQQLADFAYKAKAMGQTLNLNPAFLQQDLAASGAMAEGLGMNSAVGSAAGLYALSTGSATFAQLQGMDPRLGRLTQAESMQMAQNMSIRGTRSRSVQNAALLARVRETTGTLGGPGGARADELLRKTEAGQTLSQAESEELSGLLSGDSFRAIVEGSGVSTAQLDVWRRDMNAQDQAIIDYNLVSLTPGLQRQEVSSSVDRLMTGVFAGDGIGMGGAEAAALSTNIRKAMLRSDSVDEARRRFLSMSKAAGLTETQANVAFETYQSRMSSQMGDVLGTRAEENFFATFSDRSMAEAAAIRSQADMQAQLSRAFDSSGLGAQGAGVTGMLRNAFNAVLGADAGTPVETVLMQALGGERVDKIKGVLGEQMNIRGAAVQNAYAEASSINSEIASLRTKLTKDGITDEERTAIQAEIDAKEKEKAAAMDRATKAVEKFAEALDAVDLRTLDDGSDALRKIAARSNAVAGSDDGLAMLDQLSSGMSALKQITGEGARAQLVEKYGMERAGIIMNEDAETMAALEEEYQRALESDDPELIRATVIKMRDASRAMSARRNSEASKSAAAEVSRNKAREYMSGEGQRTMDAATAEAPPAPTQADPEPKVIEKGGAPGESKVLIQDELTNNIIGSARRVVDILGWN